MTKSKLNIPSRVAMHKEERKEKQGRLVADQGVLNAPIGEGQALPDSKISLLHDREWDTGD